MRDTELYQQLLGLEPPWSVERVQLDVKVRRVDVWVTHKQDVEWRCPECGNVRPLHDHDEERTWRHLDSCHFQTLLHARVPRVQCPEHGVRKTTAPWAEPRSRFTAMFERLAIDVLQECDIKGAAELLGISWDEAHGIMERAVARGLLRRRSTVPKHVGVDEKSIAKGHRYATLVTDLDQGKVIDVAEERSKQSLLSALGSFSFDSLSKVEAFALDMWEPYAQQLRELVPDANDKIVFDRFHIVGHMNNAVDLVRRRENRELRTDGDERLVGSKYWWLYGIENLPEKHRAAFTTLRNADLRTARAWALKESLRSLWKQPTLKAASIWWKRWHAWATRSRLTPVRQVAAMIKRHLPNVLTYFTHRITNAASEALNSVVQMLKKRAFGYRSFANYRTAILFRCGGLDLYPATHPNAG
jgi:transposase